MGSVLVIAVLACLVAAGIVEFNMWRCRKNLSPSYTAAFIAVALLGLTFLASSFSLDLWPAAVVLLAIFALSQQNRIESLLIYGRHKPSRIASPDGQ
jgi:hypothetical protein